MGKLENLHRGALNMGPAKKIQMHFLVDFFQYYNFGYEYFRRICCGSQVLGVEMCRPGFIKTFQALLRLK